MSTQNHNNDKHTTLKREYPPFVLPGDDEHYELKVVPNSAIGHVKGKSNHKLEKFETQSHCNITLVPRGFQKDHFRKAPYRMEINTKDMGIFLVTPREGANETADTLTFGKKADIDLACKMIQGEVDRSAGRSQHKSKGSTQTNTPDNDS